MTYHHRVAVPRIIAPGGPVSAALRTVLADVEACERQRVRDLRRAIAQRIAADIDLLDRLGGDPDLEDGHDREAADACEWFGHGVHRFTGGQAA